MSFTPTFVENDEQPLSSVDQAPDARSIVARRCAALRHELTSPDLSFLMEAHNGLSAKLVEEAGFPAVWASGLAISAALGVRDHNGAWWTRVLDILEIMADAPAFPTLVAGDNGCGA